MRWAGVFTGLAITLGVAASAQADDRLTEAFSQLCISAMPDRTAFQDAATRFGLNTELQENDQLTLATREKHGDALRSLELVRLDGPSEYSERRFIGSAIFVETETAASERMRETECMLFAPKPFEGADAVDSYAETFAERLAAKAGVRFVGERDVTADTRGVEQGKITWRAEPGTDAGVDASLVYKESSLGSSARDTSFWILRVDYRERAE